MSPDDHPTGPPLRVLWLIKGLGPGGAEQLLVTQARATDRDGVEPAVAFLVPWKHHLVPELEAAGVPAICLDGAREWDLRWLWRLRRLLLDERIDVVHGHSPYVSAMARLVVRTLPRSRRPALVYTEHNRWPRHDRLTRRANQLTIGLEDEVLAVSDDVAATMTVPANRSVTTVVHGIDLAATRALAAGREAARAELGIDEDEVVVGTVANFRREKDHATLLEAAAMVTEEEPRVRYVLIGQGPLEEDVRAQHARLGLGERVLLTGYRPDAARLTAAFDVFTLSSRHEGLPVALMDAMAMGIPVVATAVGGIPQAVTDGVEGLLVPPGDPGALADAHRRLVADDDLRRSAGTAAANRAAMFDGARATADLEDRYRRLMADRRGRAPSGAPAKMAP